MLHPNSCVRRFRSGLVVVLCLLAAAALAAPHNGDEFRLGQPDGSRVDVRVWGDEFYQRVESLDGYTLIRDPQSGVICYADLAKDGDRFVSTGVAVSEPAPAGLARGLELTPTARAEAAMTIRRQFLDYEASVLADKAGDPQPSSLGDVRGLTLIIDFSDEVGTVPAGDFDDYLNQVGYGGYGNNGSVRDYFHDVSGGALTYTNYVPDVYLRAPNPKTYYEDPSISYGQRARQLVGWALSQLESQGHDFTQYDANDDGYIDAINVFYAGYPTGGWAVGLWPHSSSLSFYADGISAYKYQITNIGNSLRLSTFCHENGHMIMFWPDLYDYGYESNGVGGFCLMCSSGAGTNPVRPCAYLRADAGWVVPQTLTGMQSGLVSDHDDLGVYKIPYAGHANEYYLIENRYRTGRDSSLPDSGLAIWHVDEYGDNDDEQQTPSSHYLVTLVQADGRWDLENNRNNGDTSDLWKASNYVEFNPDTDPAATWWNGSDAPVYIDGISNAGSVMTFNYREGVGTMGVTVTPQPAGMAAPWTLTGPEDYVFAGEGERSVLVWSEGQYTLTWGDVPGWSEPDPLSETFTLVDGGAPATVTGLYSNPPFATADAGVAADPGATRSVALVDVDGDGDDDLHVINDGQADRLLRNDGGMAFTDITPAGLDDAGAGRAAAWGDFDNDGDRDVYLVRDGQANLLLAQDAGTFLDVTASHYGAGVVGAGRDASWCDVDADGWLDLFLVQDAGDNVMMRAHEINGAPLLLPSTDAVLANPGPGRSAQWCDYDRDGDRDVYLVNEGTVNILARTHLGTAYENSGDVAVGSAAAGRDAAWGDFDNDGDWDLYLVNDGAADVYCRQAYGYFQAMPDPVTSDDGAGRSVTAADFDNDGVLDLYVARSGVEDLVLFGDGDGGFRRAPLALPETAGAVTSAVAADLDLDGGVDLYLGVEDAANVLLRNTIADRGHWLVVDPVGDTCNRDAVGAVVRVVAGGVTRIREIRAGDGHGEVSRAAHFGLGDAAIVDTLAVVWPGGAETVLLATGVDRRVVVEESPDLTGVDDGNVPAATQLRGAYPNPFNPSTTIAFELKTPGPVVLAIYALNGRRVAELVRDDLAAGAHEVVWQGRDAAGRAVSSGTYLCRLGTADGVHHTRLTLVK